MKTFDIGLGGYSILQSPNMTHTQMMGYIIKTPNGKLIVIDGGNPGDAGYLREQIMESGGHVDLWLITHCHDDHFCALMKILEAPDGITIDRICYNFPPRDWLETVEPSDWNRAFFEVIDANADLFQVLYEKDTLNIDGLQIEVLNDPMDFQQFTDPSPNGGSNINDTSLVFRFTFPNGKTALFLGDLGLRAGDILEAKYGDALKSDIVQMAHHGQNGAGENVYQRIRPTLCMWTAPIWLWNNDAGQGFNTHFFKTVTVRGWMEKLGVKLHAVEGEGPALVI